MTIEEATKFLQTEFPRREITYNGIAPIGHVWTCLDSWA